MSRWRRFIWATMLVISPALTPAFAIASDPILSKEPPRGELKKGDCVLVDDGSCKKGEVKRVCAGGGHSPTDRGTGDPQKRRTKTCVPRPQ